MSMVPHTSLPRRPGSPFFPTLFLAVLLWPACSPHIETSVPPPLPDTRISAIAVYPVQVPEDISPTYAYVQTVRMVERVVARHRAVVYAYDDFGGFPLTTSAPYETPSLLDSIQRDGIATEALALLESRVKPVDPDPVAPATAPQPGHRKRPGRRVEVSVALLRFSPRTAIARAWATVTLDPLQASLFDPWPQLTRILDKLAETTLTKAEQSAGFPAPHPGPPFAFYAPHPLLFQLQGKNTPALDTPKDDVGRTMALLEGYQQLYPNITALEAVTLAETPGLLITRVARGETSVQVGDLIVAADGRPCLSPHRLDRILAQHHPGDRIPVSVLRRKSRTAATAWITLGDAHP